MACIPATGGVRVSASPRTGAAKWIIRFTGRDAGPACPFRSGRAPRVGGERRHLGDRHVPPRLASGAGASGSVSTCTTVVAARASGSSERVAQLRGRPRGSTSAPRLAALAARSTGSTSPSRPVAVAVAVARAEPLRADRLRQRADRGEAVVLHQHHDELDALLHGGDQLAGHHQVRPVADQDEHLAVRRVPARALVQGHLHAQPAGDLVAHAGVAVLDVVALRVPRHATACAGRRASNRPRRPPRRAASPPR